MLYNNGEKRRNAVELGRMSFGQLIWSKGPDLLLTRHAHRSIAIQNEIYHVGGEYKNMRVINFFYSYLFNNFNLLEKLRNGRSKKMK